MWQYCIKLLEGSKYHVKHYIRKKEKRLPFFIVNGKKTDRRSGLGVKTKKIVSLRGTTYQTIVKKWSLKKFKSPKTQKYAKKGRFYIPEGRFLR